MSSLGGVHLISGLAQRKINIPNIWLIPLDHVTNMSVPLGFLNNPIFCETSCFVLDPKQGSTFVFKKHPWIFLFIHTHDELKYECPLHDG